MTDLPHTSYGCLQVSQYDIDNLKMEFKKCKGVKNKRFDEDNGRGD